MTNAAAETEYDPVAAWRALLDDVRGLNDRLEEVDRLESGRPPPLEETIDDTRDSIH